MIPSLIHNKVNPHIQHGSASSFSADHIVLEFAGLDAALEHDIDFLVRPSFSIDVQVSNSSTMFREVLTVPEL